MLRRRTRCSSNFGPSSFRRMCQRSWSRASPRSSSSCRWRRASWATRSTVPQRQPYCSPPTPSRPSLKTTTKSSTDPDTWCLNACCPTGETRLNLRIFPRLLASVSTWSHVGWVRAAIVSARCVLNYTKKEMNRIRLAASLMWSTKVDLIIESGQEVQVPSHSSISPSPPLAAWPPVTGSPNLSLPVLSLMLLAFCARVFHKYKDNLDCNGLYINKVELNELVCWDTWKCPHM